MKSNFFESLCITLLKFLLKHTIKEFFTTGGGTGEEEGAMNMIKLNTKCFSILVLILVDRCNQDIK